MNEITEKEALSRMAAFCSSSEHCKSEVCEKLRKWGLQTSEIDRIIATLQAEKYIDEGRYCRSFVSDKFRFAKWGKVKIAQALYLKKIPSDVAWEYLNEIDESDYLAVLKGLLSAKEKSIRAKDDFEQRGKLIRFALSRGFEMKDIRKCMEVPDEIS